MTPVVTVGSATADRVVDAVMIPRSQRLLGFWPRIALVGLLSVAAYAFVIEGVVVDVLAGSRAVMIVVLPLLTGMIAAGYRRAPRGVSDAESDWIVAILLGAAGLTIMKLLSNRFPTFAGLWRFDLVGIVVWVAASAAVMFGIRYVTRMWDMWVFAFSCASPLPILMTAAAFGGSDRALSVQACVLAAFAVFLASRTRPLRWRFIATLATLAVGVCAAALVLEVWHHRLALLVAVVVGAGIVPVLTFASLLKVVPAGGGHVDRAPVHASFPPRSRLSIAALVGLAVVVLVLNLPVREAGHPTAAADWVRRAGLVPTASYDFITRYLGAGATLNRYTPPTNPSDPAVAVDVITSPNPGALDDFKDALWYPASRPLNYRPTSVTGAPRIAARETHTDGDAAITDDLSDWHARTWVWRIPGGEQQVTVLVAQQAGGRLPEPRPLSLAQTITGPAAWIARQQPDPVDYLDPRVAGAGDRISRTLIAAGGLVGD